MRRNSEPWIKENRCRICGRMLDCYCCRAHPKCYAREAAKRIGKELRDKYLNTETGGSDE